jgi:hypothetical protein
VTKGRKSLQKGDKRSKKEGQNHIKEYKTVATPVYGI